MLKVQEYLRAITDQWSRKERTGDSCPPPPIFLVGGGGGGGGRAMPPIFQCTPNELVLYIVHTIACYIAQYIPYLI